MLTHKPLSGPIVNAFFEKRGTNHAHCITCHLVDRWSNNVFDAMGVSRGIQVHYSRGQDELFPIALHLGRRQ
jgi:hypothetical protein